MTQKELLENAKKVNYDEKFNYEYKSLYIINSEKAYNGFWGENSYNAIIILGLTNEGEYINITGDYQCDSYEIINLNELIPTRTDIPNDLNCIRHFVLSKKYFFKLNHCLSDVSFEVVKVESK